LGSSVRVTTRHVSASPMDLAMAALPVQVQMRRIPWNQTRDRDHAKRDA
jgi:hypothetical protein